ncbi:MAG: D-hexose-6-phosphate mutarotase [Gammaproteobacteria bacterium]|nr:D-hexose-6-phosphate mutarotase [Gammaproteobacteria bacterium]
MIDINQLSDQFSIDDHLAFRCNDNGMIAIDVDTEHASACIQLQGAHITKWEIHDQPDIIWLSDDAIFSKGKSIRGGIPVCWPWFGAHKSSTSLPAHGFARMVDWELIETRLINESIELVFCLKCSGDLQEMWPFSTELFYTISIGEKLELDLHTRNTGAIDINLSEALHSYFNVSDVRDIQLSGLDGCDYLDKLEDFRRKSQSGVIKINQEVDRVYLDTVSSCVIDDPGFKRRIMISKQGSKSTIVWNPWQETASKMGDLGDNGYLNMLCVESGNATENSVVLAPGEDHYLNVEYSVQMN